MSVTVFSIPKYRERSPVIGYTLSKEETAAQVGYNNVKVLEQDEAFEAGGMFGNAVYGAVTFQKRGKVAKDLKIGNAIIEVNSSKNIVKTPLVRTNGTGRGTVKEYISRGDDVVTISGVLVSPKGKLDRPYLQMKHLSELFDLSAELTVENELLYRLGIFALVIEQLQWLPFQYINTQPFRLTCISDDDRVYTINENQILDA